jgi:hypothetical protein
MLDGCASWCVTFASSPLWSTRKCQGRRSPSPQPECRTRIGWSFGETGFLVRYRQVSTLEFKVEVLTSCSLIMLIIFLIFSPVTLVVPSPTPSRLSPVSLQAAGDIRDPCCVLRWWLETSPQEQPTPDDHEGGWASFDVCMYPPFSFCFVHSPGTTKPWGRNALKDSASV